MTVVTSSVFCFFSKILLIICLLDFDTTMSDLESSSIYNSSKSSILFSLNFLSFPFLSFPVTIPLETSIKYISISFALSNSTLSKVFFFISSNQLIATLFSINIYSTSYIIKIITI